MALERELQTYKRKLAELAPQEGRYVLIHEDEVVGVYTSYEDALKEGYDKFGLTPFLVKKIQAVEQVQYVTRYITFPCPT